MFREICLSQKRLFYKCVVDINLKAQAFNGDAAANAFDGCSTCLLCVCNNIPYSLTGEWNLVANAQQAGVAAIERVSGSITVEGLSIQVYVNDALVK